MRKLMWLSIGFCSACVSFSYGISVWWLFLSGTAFCAAAIYWAVRRKERIALASAAVLLCGLAAGTLWFSIYNQCYLSHIRQLDQQEKNIQFTLSDPGFETDYGMAADGYLQLDGRRYLTRIYLDEKTDYSPGDQISGMFRLRVTVPGGEDDSDYHAGNGLFLIAYQQDEIEVERTENMPLWGMPVLLRQWIQQRLKLLLPEDVIGFANALLLGDSSGLDYKTDTNFKISGIRHIIAVSGLHVSLIYTILHNITLRKRFLTALLGFPVLLVFAAVAGFTPSVNRACMMVGLMMLSQLLQKDYDAPTALSFACLVMLLTNPLAITSVSFQLSVGCVAGILLFNAPIRKWLTEVILPDKQEVGKLHRAACSGISVTLSAMSLTTPISAWYFGSISLIGILSNLILLWVVNFLFMSLVLTLMISLVSVLAASILSRFLALAMRFVLMAAGVLADVPLAAVYTTSIYVTVWLIFTYILLVVLIFSKKRQPVITICLIIAGLCLALIVSWIEPMMWNTRVTVIDVGQGQSILLQSQGKSFLVDCGGDSESKTADLVSQNLLSQGIERLDGIILTHYDGDHAGALENLLTRIDTGFLLLPETEGSEKVPYLTGKTLFIGEDIEIQFGNATLTVFGPIYGGESNENSLCVLFETEKCDILITGDRSEHGEQLLMRKVQLPDVDVLVAGHHGAAGSTSEQLLRVTKPETVLISVGKGNVYGHPAPELLNRLAGFGCRVYRTDRDGTILYRR